MLKRLAEEKVFKDPIHNYIHVQDQVIWDLINTKEFQRLRRIRQLGTSYLTFHSAEHSRFSHSLGVYEITRKIISQFDRYHYMDLTDEEKILCLIAALLHDIGHGPFSHSIEEVFGVNHEVWTCQILTENTEINHVLRAIDSSFPQKIVSIIQRKSTKPIMTHLVSSSLDADRMDYLLRDAYFIGVNYGTFDLDRILRMLRPFEDRIVVKDSGMHAVEHYLMSRYHMYWQVYFHPVTRSSEIILRQIFRRAKQCYEQGYTFNFLIQPLPALFSGELSVDSFLMLDEALIQTLFLQWTRESDALLSDLCRRFMHRKLYQYVAVEPEVAANIKDICDAFAAAGLDPDYDIELDFPTDLPYDVYRPGQKATNQQIMLLNGEEKLIEISVASDIVRSISGIQQGKHYLYYPKDKVVQAKAGLLPEYCRLLLL